MRLSLLLLAMLTGCTSLQMAPYRTSGGKAPVRTVAGYTQSRSFVLKWPVNNARMTRGFSPYRKNHYGIDLAKGFGEPIYAAHDGKVVYVGNKYRGFGKLIIIEHPNGWGSLYAHNSKILVHENDWVEVGQRIALMGQTGNARGVHLHFELRDKKKAVDPVLHLPKL
ncbi:MAG: M23 family metallopeptidase [Bdellovibrionales bacterium]|nr:M23 family metallopeptidase [Bdellovibrionales bacterium]